MGKKLLRLTMFVVVLLTLTAIVFAEPGGTTISANSTNLGRTSTPANRSDPGGTITTMLLDAVQQNAQWKAYVGNISGSLTLDDSAGNTIYEWSLGAASVTGEIFASRSNSVTWSNINCSNITTVQSEQTALGITDTTTDSIKNTFNYTVHPALVVAGRSITQNTCNATSTFVSGARQSQASATFPELLLHDNTNLVYATILTQDDTGYGGSETYDFQMIIADNPSVTSSMYYFYAELGS
ncbi:MAG: hypothetical protein WC758_04710 [Candidatus Woesearchaeota archaeon]|jgi:hypothetical protein